MKPLHSSYGSDSQRGSSSERPYALCKITRIPALDLAPVPHDTNVLIFPLWLQHVLGTQETHLDAHLTLQAHLLSTYYSLNPHLEMLQRP